MTQSFLPVSDLHAAAEVIGRAFQPNPLNLYVTKHQPLEQNIKDFETRLIQLRDEADGYIVQSDPQLTSVAVWIPPQHRIPAFPEPLIDEFREAEDAYATLAKRYLGAKKFWHLTILAKDPLSAHIKGSTSNVVRPFLELAKKEGVPAMLECIDERAKIIYEHYGFEIVEEFKVGVGKCDKNGNSCANGEGITLYYMIFNL